MRVRVLRTSSPSSRGSAGKRAGGSGKGSPIANSDSTDDEATSRGHRPNPGRFSGSALADRLRGAARRGRLRDRHPGAQGVPLTVLGRPQALAKTSCPGRAAARGSSRTGRSQAACGSRRRGRAGGHLRRPAAAAWGAQPRRQRPQPEHLRAPAPMTQVQAGRAPAPRPPCRQRSSRARRVGPKPCAGSSSPDCFTFDR